MSCRAQASASSFSGSRWNGVASKMLYLLDLRIVHGEAVVMLAGDHDVLHAGVLRHLHPRFGVELHGIELLRELLVFASPESWRGS